MVARLARLAAGGGAARRRHPRRGPVRARARRGGRPRPDRPAGRGRRAARPPAPDSSTCSPSRALRAGADPDRDRLQDRLARRGRAGGARASATRLSASSTRSRVASRRRRRSASARCERSTSSSRPPTSRWSSSFDAAGLAAARERLEAVIAEIRAGGDGFEPTSRPSHSVCFGCPAAERLCPHPKWKPGWRVSRLAVFAYGSLVSAASAAETLGRPVGAGGPARLDGLAARLDAGARQPRARRRPSPAPTARCRASASASTSSPTEAAPAPNGALIELTEAELERLDLREMRYRPRRRHRRRSTGGDASFDARVRLQRTPRAPPSDARPTTRS